MTTGDDDDDAAAIRHRTSQPTATITYRNLSTTSSPPRLFSNNASAIASQDPAGWVLNNLVGIDDDFDIDTVFRRRSCRRLTILLFLFSATRHHEPSISLRTATFVIAASRYHCE